MEVDYGNLTRIDTVKTSDGYQLEKYLDETDGTYQAHLRQGRLGPLLIHRSGYQEADVDQIMIGAVDEDINIVELLEGGS